METASVYHPIQNIRWCDLNDSKEHGIFIAACGPHLFSISVKTGEKLCVWSSEPPRVDTDDSPAKKRKINPETPSKVLNITGLLVTSNSRHAVAVTGEDKCVHVLAIGNDGYLEHLSRRCMPKRPSALATTPDGSYVLVADKFGDVYSIPLLQNADEESAFLTDLEAKDQQKTYKPAATTLTVHSQRNLKALKQQLKQKSEPAKIKEPLRFSHQLVLGHVSMLTAMLSVHVPHGEKHRDYIITADRDEHIRVSRGVPQAHITETYCLGHGTFVSALCIVRSDVLVSGDGDGYLHVWDWTHGRSIKRIDIDQYLQGIDQSSGGTHDDHGRAAISGLWAYPSGSQARYLLIACEGHDKLWYITTEDLLDPQVDKLTGSFNLDANILDLAIFGSKILVSRDNVHVARSMDEPRNQSESASNSKGEDVAHLAAAAKTDRLCVIEYSEALGQFRDIAPTDESREALARMNDAVEVRVAESSFRDVIYGLHNLKKRGGDETGEDPS